MCYWCGSNIDHNLHNCYKKQIIRLTYLIETFIHLPSSISRMARRLFILVQNWPVLIYSVTNTSHFNNPTFYWHTDQPCILDAICAQKSTKILDFKPPLHLIVKKLPRVKFVQVKLSFCIVQNKQILMVYGIYHLHWN